MFECFTVLFYFMFLYTYKCSCSSPRSSRGKPHQSVTRKSKSSVDAISEEAQSMLVDLFSSANDATTHAKRKTLMKADLQLVNSILSKHGLTC